MMDDGQEVRREGRMEGQHSQPYASGAGLIPVWMDGGAEHREYEPHKIIDDE